MAQIRRKEIIKTPLHCSHFVFYDFIMTQANLLQTVSPRNVRKIELVYPTTSWEVNKGSRKLVHYDEGGLEYFKDEVAEVDRAACKVTYKMLEGTMLQFYESFVATLEVMPGTAKWTVEFQKKSESCPDPDRYFEHLKSVNKDIDSYLSPKE